MDLQTFDSNLMIGNILKILKKLDFSNFDIIFIDPNDLTLFDLILWISEHFIRFQRFGKVKDLQEFQRFVTIFKIYMNLTLNV